MHYIPLYLFKLSICLAVVFLFYYLVLRKLTFYNWNRIYLLVYPLLSFGLASINIGPALQQSDLGNTAWTEWLPTVQMDHIITLPENLPVTAAASWSIGNWILCIILAGIVLMLLRFMILVFSLRKLIKGAEHFSENGLHFYQVNDNIIPFSFGNAIFLNKELHTHSELQKIIRHELVHIRQKHSIDILWAELLCILNWYNPFVWLIKNSIRQNLEFIADDNVLRAGINKEQYQYSLLKVAGNTQFSITSNFNFSALKMRIAMMNKNKTSQKHLVKFLLLLPLAAILLLSFRQDLPIPLTPFKIETSVFPKRNAPLEMASVPTPSSTPAIKKPSASYHAPVSPVSIPQPEGFTGLQGIISDGEISKEDLAAKFIEINGRYHYYTRYGNKTTYYNQNGQEIDITGKLLSSTPTNASEVLPRQYIFRVYKDGEIISTFNDDKGWATQ